MSPIIHQETFNAIYEAGISNAEVVVPNYGVLRESWSGYSLQRLGNVTPFGISSLNETGRVQVATDNASVRFWFMPYWSSSSTGEGNGPGSVARLLELAAEDKGQAVTLWKLAVNEDDSVLSLIGSGDLGEVVLLKAEIAWRAGEWHQIVLTYGSKGTELVLDGEKVAEGAGTIVVPPKVARLVVGSSLTGEKPAGGEVDELFCFSKPLKMAFHYTSFKEQAALGPVTDAELQARAEKLAKRKAELEARKALEGESGGGMMLRMSGPSASCVTNGPVYLTNVLATLTANDGWTVYFDIAGGTNGVVYDIFSTPELAGNDVTNSVWTWMETGQTCETHYFTNQPTNQMFYILTVPGADRDADGMYDGWEWKHFGTLAQTEEGDFDGDGIWNESEFFNGSDPNNISALLQFDSVWVSSTSVTGSVEELAGHPAQIAILVESTNFSGAVWRSYNSNFIANLNPTDGIQKVWVGLRGHAEDSEPLWNCIHIVLDRVPPLLAITNPVAATGSVPMIQLQGYCSEALESLRFDVTNSAGLLTNQQGFISSQFYDASLRTFTTNYFQCFDIDLTNGLNIVTLRAIDVAGNVTVTNYSFTLDYASKTNPPVVQLIWPQDGMEIGGVAFTVRGLVEDPTASVTAQIVNTSGETNTANGLVERDGKFWVEDLPLSSGTNVLTIVVTDAVGNTSVTNISLAPSQVVITMSPVTPDSQLWQPTVKLSGTITALDYAVWVNGVKGTNHGDGTWSANHVPVNKGGTATFEVIAYAPNEQQPDGSYGN